jgi:hypothetical protein
MRNKFFLGLGVFLGILAIFAIFVAMQPDEYIVERSTTMTAPPDVVFNQVNDFHKWQAWSPWAKLDPQAQNTFAGSDAGEGAKFSWSGNNEVGEGNMTIVESRPPEHIKVDLHFIKPFEGKADTHFHFAPEGDGTKVTWRMEGQNNFFGKLMCLFMDMDKMIGDKYDEGLAEMKKVAEAEVPIGLTPPESTPAESATPAEPTTDAAPPAESATEPANPANP